MIPFQKYHGTGNDFILIDDRKSQMQWGVNQVKELCDRHFGIGADGLILIREKGGYDFEMLYYNSDGNIGSMCGNGGRCAVAFANTIGIAQTDKGFYAFDGPHKALVISRNPYLIRLQMSDVFNVETGKDFIFMNTGSPHYTVFVNDVKNIDIVAKGREVRYNERFKDVGTNINFVEKRENDLFVRTYERGVEDETLSCGTGVTAAALSASVLGYQLGNESELETPGGRLRVYYKRRQDGFEDVWLEGPAQMVFEGII